MKINENFALKNVKRIISSFIKALDSDPFFMYLQLCKPPSLFLNLKLTTDSTIEQFNHLTVCFTTTLHRQ